MDTGEVEQQVHVPEMPEKEPFFRSWLNFARRRWLLVLGIVVGIWLAAEIVTLPFAAVVRLQKENPGETAFMADYADQMKEAGKRVRIVQKWIPLSEVPQDVVNAVIVAEDGRFWTHGGFDWFEFKESVERNIKEGRAARGASTITQQLVKNLYLSSSKNPLRKLREWILTWWMEQNLKKSRILEIYLNVIEWGRGVYGIEGASQVYFGKSARELTLDEGLRLAAIIPSPKRHEANEESNYVERRTGIILNRMAARGMLKDSAEGATVPDSLAEMPDDSINVMLEDSTDELQRY